MSSSNATKDATTLSTPRPVIYLTGDSLTQRGTDPDNAGWVALMQHRYNRSADIVPRGLSGYNTKCVSLQPQQQLVDSTQEPRRLSAVNFQIPAEAPDIYARLEEIQRQITKYEVHVPAWFEYLSCSRTNRERRVGYVVVVREYVDEPPTRDEEEPKPSRRGRKKRKTPRKDRKTMNERVLLLPALAAFALLSFLEHRQVGKKKSADDARDLAGSRTGISSLDASA